MTIQQPTLQFSDMGIAPSLLKVLNQLKLTTPTPIQSQSIPKGLEGLDILGIAQTGTGKTLSFGIPILQNMQGQGGKALILLPTRELAQQVQESLQPFCRALNYRSAVLIGGVAMHGQLRDLRSRPQLIIATPGRLADVMRQGYLKLNDVSFLVLDEADRMFDMGFAPQITEILKHVPKERQTLLFSATMPENVVKLTREYMIKPVRIEVAPAGTAAEKVEQAVYLVKREQKPLLLQKIVSETTETMIVFTRTKFGAKRLNEILRDHGVKSAEIHSNRSQAQRREALQGFKSGRYSILIATDIAARGIDVPNIGTVVNFDLPDNTDDYVHRIGRTGRAGKSGYAVSFAEPSQRRDLRYIEKLIKKPLILLDMPNLKDIVFKNPEPRPASPFENNSYAPRDSRFERRPRRDDRPYRNDRSSRDDRSYNDNRPSRDTKPNREEFYRNERPSRNASTAQNENAPSRRSYEASTQPQREKRFASKEKTPGYLSDSKPFQKKEKKSSAPSTSKTLAAISKVKKAHRKGKAPKEAFSN